MSAKKKRASRAGGSRAQSTRGGSDAVRSWHLSPVAVAVALSALAVYAPKLPFALPYTSRFAATLLSACVWLWALALLPSRARVRRSRLQLAVVAVAATTLLSSLTSFSPRAALTFGAEGGLMGAPMWLALLIVFASAASVKLDPTMRYATWALFLWGVVAACWGVLENTNHAHVSAAFGNGNYLGAALVALVPLAIHEAAAAKDPTWVTAWRVIALVLVAGVVASGSLAAWIALAVGVALMLGVAPEDLGVSRRAGRSAFVVVSALLLVGVLVIGLSMGQGILPDGIDRFVEEQVVGSGSTVSRIEMWKIAGRVWIDHPFLGVGPDGLQHASQGYLTEGLLRSVSGNYTDYRVMVRDPHSLPLLALASMGAIGVLALGWLAYEWAVAWIGGWRTARGRSESGWSVAAGIGAVSYMACMVAVPWAVTFGPLAALLAGLAIASAPDGTADTRLDGETAASRGGLLVGAAVVASLAAAWLVGAAFLGDWHIHQVGGTTDPEIARSHYLDAARVQPGRAYPRYEELYAFGFLASDGFAPLNAYQQAADAAPREITEDGGYLANLVQVSLDQAYLTRRSELEWERARLDKAAALAPLHPDVLLEQAHLAALDGRDGDASTILERVADVAPRAARLELYRYYTAQARGDVAEAARLKALLPKALPGQDRLWSR